MAVTIKDIAIRTGLAISTISKYLNGGNVLPENQVKIQKTIDELGFSANTFARGLKTNKSYRIGIVAESLEDQMQSGIILRLEPILRRHGYTAVITDCGYDVEKQLEAVEYLISGHVDAVVIIPMSIDNGMIQLCREHEIPVIAVLNKPEDTDVDCVLLDYYSAAYSAVRHFISNHHRNIAIIGGAENDNGSKLCCQGYSTAMKNAQLPLREEYFSFGGGSAASGYERLKIMMSQPEPPRAVLLADFRITVGGLLAAKELGLDIPGELALIGFGNVELAQTVSPKLHVMVNPLDRIASAVSSLLMERMAEKTPSPIQIYKFPTEFFIGESV